MKKVKTVMNNSPSRTIVWVDLLCWSSALKLIWLSRTSGIKQVYFINTLVCFKNHIALLERWLKCPCRQVTAIVEGESKIEGHSLFERIQQDIKEIFDAWLEEGSAAEASQMFCQIHAYEKQKFDAFLRQEAYSKVFRIAEMNVLSQYTCPGADIIFLIRRSPLRILIQAIFGRDKTMFYRTFFSHRMKVDCRPDFYFDKVLNEKYFSDRVFMVGKFLFTWILNVLSGFLSCFQTSPAKQKQNCGIGVEFIQSRFRGDQINDMPWLDGSGIDPKNVYGIEMENYDDESIRILREKGIKRVKVADSPMSFFRRLLMPVGRQDFILVSGDAAYGVRTIARVLSLLRCLLVWNEKDWIHFQCSRYLCRTMWWQMIYRRLGIKILWTMYDIDQDKLPKSQAIGLLGGFYTGSHWSNFPGYSVYNEKCYDVLFTWGEHFIKNNFNNYAFEAAFLVGYPCDYYFKMYNEKAGMIRERHKGNFIISYHDNIMANDLQYSKGMQLEIHQMLLSILKKFDNTVIFLKPKRKFVLDEIFLLLPELAQYFKEGRVEVFLGETLRTKAVPAEIGMASDLVIGLGISTTAAESFFAGTVAFHADLTGFMHNEFANRGEGAVVFRDIFTLENAVIDRIKGKNKWSYDDYRGYYMTLDPFQDGCSAKRIGFILKKIREYLAQGLGHQELLKRVSRDYDSYLLSLPNLQRMSWN